MKMSAAVLDGVGGRFDVDEVDIEGPRKNEVLIKIHASGLCGSDLNVVDGKRSLVPFPAVLGHEAAGVVVEIGPGVTELRAGDSVVTSIVPSCGSCRMCNNGKHNYCEIAGRAMGKGSSLDGTFRISDSGERIHQFLTISSFAEYAVVPVSGTVAIDPRMPLDRAALLSCAVLTGYGAVHNTAQVSRGSRVAVYGCGGVGLNVVQGAKVAGASCIIAVDVDGHKLDKALELGATDVVDSSGQDPITAIRAVSGGVDYAFEALGREETVLSAWSSLDAGGEAVVVGLMKDGATVRLPADPFVNENAIRGSYFGSTNIHNDVPVLVQKYLNGDVLLDPLIDQKIDLNHLNEAFDDLRAGKGLRTVLTFE